MNFRRYFQASLNEPQGSKAPPIEATIAAEKATHLSSAIVQTFSNAQGAVHRFPITLPIEQIVDGLNNLQPTLLSGYPSALHLLVHEARVGRLHLAPKEVITFAEPLLPETHHALEDTWKVPIINAWSCSEGGAAESCGKGRGMHLNDDFCMVEPVDVQGKPVPSGVPSAKVYLTNLFNHTLPLIRYEVTDEVTILDEPCSCGSAHRRIDDVMGRLDDSFTYISGIRIHPHLFRSALASEQNILAYQVQQTPCGAAISIRCSGEIDIPLLQSKISNGLAAHGLQGPVVSIEQVDRFERLETGKLKRFLPL